MKKHNGPTCENNTSNMPFLPDAGPLLRAANIGLFRYSVSSGAAEYDGVWEAIAGYAPGAAQGIAARDVRIVAADADRVHEKMRALEAGSASSYTIDYRMLRPDGEIVWVRETACVSDADGNACIHGMAMDITKEKLHEEREARLCEALAENRQKSSELENEKDAAILKLEESEQMRSAMFDANPYINILMNDKMQVLDCNPAALEYFNFSSKEAFIKGVLPAIGAGIPAYQPDGRHSIPLQERFLKTMQDGINAFETELVINGKSTPFNVIAKRISYMNSSALVVYMLDLLAIKEAKSGLVRRDRLLRAANSAATLLISETGQELRDVIRRSLQMMGEGVDTDRTFLYRNVYYDGALCCGGVAQWDRYETNAEVYKNVPYAAILPNWEATLSMGKSIRTLEGNFSGALLNAPELRSVKSVLIAPISLLGEFWGFIGFVSGSVEREFTVMEESILKSVGLMLASAIQREEMTESLVHAKEEALASTNAKSEFLSRMSHEIRTPMNAIIGMTAIARKANELERIRHCLSSIDTSSRQLLNIINDVLDMSKIEANKLEINLHEFDFERMMQNVFNVIQGRVEEKRQDFNLDIQSIFTRYAVSDELRLSQVLINLLNNAVKFTPEGGSIKLCVRQTPTGKDASLLHVEVIDSGIGIPEEQREKLFHSFEQADGGITRKYGGTGLGLAICKKIITLMSGKIWVESTPGEGSRFIFEVKIGWGSSCRYDLETYVPGSGLRVLVVDDQQDVLEYFKNILKGFSIQCDAAASGREGMHLALKRKSEGETYDLIFIDWMMPDWNGAVTAREIRNVFPEATIVMISGTDWEEIGAAVEPYGITHFLPKPILPSVLYNTVVQLTQHTLITQKKETVDIVQDWRGKRLLIVEDIEVNREIILSILEETQVMIETAGDGLQAVELYRRDPDRYDMILMDVQMPVLDGLGATRQIRSSADARAKTIPIVAMTANAFKEDVDACLAAGMNNHIAKPIEVDALITTLAYYLNKAE